MDFSDIASVSLQDMLLVRAIADKGSVSQAALTLRVAQPTATYRLNKLRDIFRDPIFVNVNRQMRPTDIGDRMISAFRSQIDGFANLIEPDNFDPETSGREFRIISHGVLIPGLLTGVPQKFFAATNNARLFFRSGENDLTINQQLHERADFFAWSFNSKGAVGIRRMVSPRLKIVMHYDANVRKPPTTIQEFSNCKFVVLDVMAHKHGLVDLALIERGLPPCRAFCLAPTIESVTQFIRGTDLIYTGTKYFSEGNPFALATAEIPFEVQGIRHELRWSISKENNSGHAWMLNLLTNASREIASQSARVDPLEPFTTLTEFEELPNA